MMKKKRCITIIAIALLAVCGIAVYQMFFAVEAPLSEDELQQMQALMSDRTALEQALSQNAHTADQKEPCRAVDVKQA